MENTVFYKVKDLVAGDHLHIRGEYYIYSDTDSIKMGSSPHTWRIPAGKVVFKTP